MTPTPHILAQSIAPAWFVLPVSIFTLIVIAAHWVMLAKADMPPLRKRVRSACGLASMLAVPVLAYAFGIADVDSPRQFVLSWMTATVLLLIVLVLAGIDLSVTAWDARRQLVRLRKDALSKGLKVVKPAQDVAPQQADTSKS